MTHQLIDFYDDSDIPRHNKRGRKPGQKKFGIEQWNDWFGEWRIRHWYPTAKTRDQAFEDLKRHVRAVHKLRTNYLYRKTNR